MGHIIIRTGRNVKITSIMAEEFLGNEMVKKDKIQKANRFNEFKDHYTHLYENDKPEKHNVIKYDPIVNTPHVELSPLLSTRREHRDTMEMKCTLVKISEGTLRYITCRYWHEKQDDK